MSLLAPPLLAEVAVYVRPDGTFRFTASAVLADADKEKIVRALLRTAKELAALYHLQLTLPDGRPL